MPVQTESVRFRPRARLVDTIGADLIRDEMAGVVELVKNAYDADARSVTIRFEHLLDPTESAIVIDDDGHGMSRDALLNGWMSPATHLKEVERESPSGRPMLGRKGIGRFSAMRLGDVLRDARSRSACVPTFGSRLRGLPGARSLHLWEPSTAG